MQKSLPILLSLSCSAFAAQNASCAPIPPVCYSTDACNCQYCLGPAQTIANAPCRPKTCNGDWMITIAGLYWNAHQDGMEYAVDTHVTNPNQVLQNIPQLNNLIDAEYRTPDFNWNFGFKVGIGYNTTCDGWDFGVVWTWYRGDAKDQIETEPDDNHTLIPLWSAWAPAAGGITYATDIESFWRLKLNLFDIELGREFWTSKYLCIRPHVGLRVAFLDQNFELQYKGGSWSARTIAPLQEPFNNRVDLDNDFKGVGVRAGFNSLWHFGCGWAIYGDLATSIVYGKFSVDHDEQNRFAEDFFSKIKVLEAKDDFRASRAMLDLGLGIQWSGMICSCQYGLTIKLGWEQHLFFHQNQLWRVVRIGDTGPVVTMNGPPGQNQFGTLPNDTGENVHHQRRGTLDTQGATLTVKFEF